MPTLFTSTSTARRLAIANSIPAVDPVTSAIFPVSFRSTSFSDRKPGGLLSSRCCWLCLREFSVLWRFPFDPFQIEYENRVEDWDQEQGNEGCHSESEIGRAHV